MTRLSLLLSSLALLGCIAEDDLQVCPGQSLLQASTHRSIERSVEIENIAAATASYHVFSNVAVTEDFRHTLGEILLILICFLVVVGIYWCSRPSTSKTNKATATGPHTSGEAAARPDDTSASSSSDPKATASAKDGKTQRKTERKPTFDATASIAAFAYTEESDGEDFQVGGDDQQGDSNEVSVPDYIEKKFSSWSLLTQLAGALAQFWGALAFMYWSLLQGHELMDCEDYRPDEPYFTLVTHSCHYTLACLRGFPVLAANMILVLMIRTLVQNRTYYSMLRQGYLIVFQSMPVMNTMWPWVVAFSMLQGGLHFALKAFFRPEPYSVVMWLRLVRKFVLPGSIFFSVLFRFADVEKTLVPLNHIAELEHSGDQDHSEFLAGLTILNERVLAFDVIHRDVYAETVADIGRMPKLKEVIQNVISNYEHAQTVWHARVHRSWGLFRSLWPSSLLLDRRLDSTDPETRSWIIVAAILMGGCGITAVLSVSVCLSATSPDAWHLFAKNIKSIFTRQAYEATPATLSNFVILLHALCVVGLLVNTIHYMFYAYFAPTEVENAMKKAVSDPDQAVQALKRTAEKMQPKELKESEATTGLKGEAKSKPQATGFYAALKSDLTDATAAQPGGSSASSSDQEHLEATASSKDGKNQKASIAALASADVSDGDGTDEEPEYDTTTIPTYVDKHFSSWKLLMQITLSLAQFWGALGFMYWSLLNNTDELMDCESYRPNEPYFTLVTHSCHYTLSFLKGFPVLAANMILVLMLRTLMQTRIYYSMLREGNVIVFQSTPVMKTMWPWVIAFSMFQGALHFALKAYCRPELHSLAVWVRLVRKFVLPGSIFFSMLFRFADVENTLVPLNHIAELDHAQDQAHSPWLKDMKIMNERVLAFDILHRDVYGETLADLGCTPTLSDLIDNVIGNYENAKGVWHTRVHRSWGLFRSLWPASLLLDRRLDFTDRETSSWHRASIILLGGCAITSLLSIHTFLSATSPDAWHLFAQNIKSIFTSQAYEATPTTLGNSVTILHAVAVVVLLVSTVHHMFYFFFTPNEVEKAMNMVRSNPGEAISQALARPGPVVKSEARKRKEAKQEAADAKARTKSDEAGGFFDSLKNGILDASAEIE